MKGTLEDLKEILQLHESCGTKVAQNENFEEYQNQVFKRSRDTLQSYLQALQKLTSHWVRFLCTFPDVIIIPTDRFFSSYTGEFDSEYD